MVATLLFCLFLVLCAGLFVITLVIFRELLQRVDPFAASVLKLLFMYEERSRAPVHEASMAKKERL